MAVTPSPSKDTIKPNNLPPINRIITTHNDEGKATIYSASPLPSQTFDDDHMSFRLIYTNTFPANLNHNADLAAHSSLEQAGVGLVNPKGTVIRTVDFCPGYQCMMHRTQSLDFGIVMEGSVEMVLDSGERQKMEKGDVAVQRATMHSWANTSETEWARMLFVLQDCEVLEVGGVEMREDLGSSADMVQTSGTSN